MNLPDEIILDIFSKTKYLELSKLNILNKTFNKLFKLESTYKLIINNMFPHVSNIIKNMDDQIYTYQDYGIMMKILIKYNIEIINDIKIPNNIITYFKYGMSPVYIIPDGFIDDKHIDKFYEIVFNDTDYMNDLKYHGVI